MTRSYLHILLGVALSGCTFNNYQLAFHLAETNTSVKEVVVNRTVQITETPAAPTKPEGNPRIRAECGVYAPLPVPAPAKIDFKELEAAQTSKEINAIALRNVEELHSQLKSYAVSQRRHYAEYVSRCVVKE